MPWFSKANEYEKPINVATSVGNIDANWQTILAVSDKLQLDDSAGQGDAVEAMLARLKTGNAKVQVQAIKLMKACAANVGKKFQVALCCHPFATEIKKMLAPRSATKPEVQAELKGALVEWREWARQDPQLHMMETTISDLERMGVSMVVVDPAAQKREEEQRRAQEKEKEELELALALSQSAAEANGGGGTAMAAPAPSPGASGGFRPRPAKCLYTFEGTEDGELSFSAGDIVVITNKSDDNWWKGSNAAGTEGYFPAHFVTFDMEAARRQAQARRAAAECAKIPDPPPQWTKEWDATTSRVYFYNPTTKTSVWTLVEVMAFVRVVEEAARAQAEAERRTADKVWARSIGGTEEEVLAVLEECGGNRDRAANRIMNRLRGLDDDVAAAAAPAAHVNTTGPSRVVMHEDAHPPMAFDHGEWVQLRDRLFHAPSSSQHPRATKAREVAKAMNVIQDDYSTRMSEVAIKGALIAEHFAIGRAGVMQLQLQSNTLYDHIEELARTQAISREVKDALSTLRKLGNNARHANLPPISPADKPKIAEAVFLVASATETIIFGDAARARSARGGGLFARANVIRTALDILTPAAQMVDVVREANDKLGLPHNGTIPDRIAAIEAALGV